MHIFKRTEPPVGGGKSLNEWVNRFVQNAESLHHQVTKHHQVLLGECADLCLELFSLVKQ